MVRNTVWKLEQQPDSQQYSIEARTEAGRSGMQQVSQKYSMEAGTVVGRLEEREI